MKPRCRRNAMQMFLTALGCVNALLFSTGTAVAQQKKSAEEILRSYVEDFRHDPAAAQAITFGIRITGDGGGDWHVVVSGDKPGAGDHGVTLRPGLPAQPAAYFTLDLEMLRKIDAGEMNALTAMGKASGRDITPMDVETMPGFDLEPAYLKRFVPFLFHFWTRGLPERVRFIDTKSRVIHGANSVIFYYQEGFRSGWFHLSKGQHMNRDPNDQTNVFPSMFIMLRGKARAKVSGKEVTFPANEMLFVPAGVTHEFWNPYDEPAEMIILMFGEGA